MLEFFEQKNKIATGAEESEIKKLHTWLCKEDFPMQSLQPSYLEFLRESNGGDFCNGCREYQFLSIGEIQV